MKLAATSKYGYSEDLLIKATGENLADPLPLHLRIAGWFLVCLCSSAFFLGPLLLMLPLVLYFYYPKAAATLLCIDVALAFCPVEPWKRFRTFFLLWFEIFDYHHNVTPKMKKVAMDANHLSIYANHPHGVIPLHGFLWAAFCHDFLTDLYGVGCTTDAALRLPILRHILMSLSIGSARKDAILDAMQIKNENLYILPGGVAEIFLSHRRPDNEAITEPHFQTIKARRPGLMKLAFQTGAAIYPVYVFGVTDLFDHLVPVKKGRSKEGKHHEHLTIFDRLSGMAESLSRRVQGGLTVYWGQYYLPMIPHNPRITMVMGDPIYPVPGEFELNVKGDKRTCKRVPNPTSEQIEELMEQYVDSLHRLFEQYKELAGYPNDTLQIL